MFIYPKTFNVGWVGFSAHAVNHTPSPYGAQSTPRRGACSMRTIGACTKNLPAGLDVAASFTHLIFVSRNSLHYGLMHIDRLYRVGKKSCPPYRAARVSRNVKSNFKTNFKPKKTKNKKSSFKGQGSNEHTSHRSHASRRTGKRRRCPGRRRRARHCHRAWKTRCCPTSTPDPSSLPNHTRL